MEVLNINIPEQPGPRPVIEDNLGKGKIQLKPFTLGGRESVVLLIQLAERINNDIIIDTHIPTVKKFPTKVPIHTRPRVHLFSRREMIIGVLSLAAGSLGLALFDKYLLPPPPPSLMATPTATLQPTNRLQYIYHGHSRGVFSVRWSHSGKYIASTGLDQTIQVWDLTGKTLLNNSLYGTGEAVTWSPDDMYVATVDDFDGGQVHIFDLKVGRSIYAYPQANQLRSVEWSPDGKYLAFAGIDGNVYALDVTDLKRISLINTYKGHKNAVNSISWSPDSRYIASGSKDTTIQIWGAIDGSYISIYTMHSSEVFTVAWSADGQYIASGDRSGVLNVWDTPLAHPKTILSQTFSGLQGHTCAHAVSWSSDSHYVAFGSWNKTVIAFRLKDLFPFPPYESQRGAIGAVAWQPKSYLIATASSDDSDTTVQIWQGVQ
ncbi:MAG TPA: WD40 repeat domain-containing protein [Ktedonobacteraceae bacterium]|nr:WD40 repeat domain-containing protein [Ktedonobacteraceae bacterium]